jgi:DNA-binding NarL/FixJ family response regulator
MPSDHPAIRCVIADDHPPILDAIARVLESHGIRIVGSAGNGLDALELIQRERPEVALVDVRMPGLSGMELARRAATECPGTAICLYTGHSERAVLLEAADIGVRGFVLKEAPLVDLVRAIETVAGGGTYVDPVLAGILTSVDAMKKLTVLTPREREVLRLLADGMRNEDIGRELHISPDTVRAHVRKAMERLDADTRTAAVAAALRQQLIS